MQSPGRDRAAAIFERRDVVLGIGKLCRAATWIGAAVIVVMSLLPSDDVPGALLAAPDWALHSVGYAGVGFVAALGYRSAWAIKPVVWLIVLGGGLEVAQGLLIPGRSAEFSDLAADAIGAALGCAVGLMLLPWLRPR